jgi:hypothetical protein
VDDATLADAAFHSRLDKLLESAIEEQEREQQGFLTVLQASRDAVDAVKSELDGVRSFIEHREQAVIDLLDGRLALAARQDTIEFLQHRIELLEGEQAALKKALTVKLDGIARSLEAVEWRTQEGMAALANRVGGLESTVAAHTQSVAERLGAVDHRDGDLAATTVAALKELGESLFARLVEREERLERHRDQILADLLNEFAGIAKPREQKRIASGLREAEEHRKQRRDAGRVGTLDDGLPPPPLDAYGAGAGEGPPGPGNHGSEMSGPYDVSGSPDPVPVPVASDAGRRGRRGRKPSL